EERSVPYAAGTSFHQHLLNQLNTFSLKESEREIAEFLVGSVDESGYIRRDIVDIVDDLAFTQNIYSEQEEVEKVLHIVQQLDPAGVCARDLRECLLLQLQRKEPTDAVELASDILDRSFEQFTKKHYQKLILKHATNEEDLTKAIHEIERLKPKPGCLYAGSNRMVEHVVPDFTIRIMDWELELSLNGRNAPDLQVSHTYNTMFKGYK